MQIVISPRHKPTKKLEARIDGKQYVYFGHAGASDFTIHQDPERKERYIVRRSKNEDWSNPLTAGFYSRWILWNQPTITESIRDTNRPFPNLNIIYKS